MLRIFQNSIVLIAVIQFLSFNLFSQNDTVLSEKAALNIIIDGRYDPVFTKKEISYVNYVRDTKVADVHIIISRQDAGNGGDEYSFYFYGQRRFFGVNDTLVFVTQPDNTWDRTRREITKYLKLGLMQYVVKTPLAKNLEINYIGNQGEEKKNIDKWNNWIFRINLSGSFNGESSYKEMYQRSEFSADKITEDWKLEFEAGNRFNMSTFSYEDENIIGISRRYYFKHLAVKSLNKHWSAGWKIRAGNATYSNYEFYLNLFPAIEYNVFPYSESSLKQLRIMLSSGYKYSQYIETTIYDKTRENLFESEIDIAYLITQKWGSINTSFETSVYMHDFSKYAMDLFFRVHLRVTKGLSLFLSGGAGLVHNQLNLPIGELSLEEVLLQQTQLATDYRYWYSAGFTYTFGSIYNNIVNPRFGN